MAYVVNGNIISNGLTLQEAKDRSANIQLEVDGIVGRIAVKETKKAQVAKTQADKDALQSRIDKLTETKATKENKKIELDAAIVELEGQL